MTKKGRPCMGGAMVGQRYCGPHMTTAHIEAAEEVAGDDPHDVFESQMGAIMLKWAWSLGADDAFLERAADSFTGGVEALDKLRGTPR